MMKKILIGTATLGLVSFFLFGTSAVSHFKQSASWLRQTVKDSVPAEYELDRARALIEETGPQIRDCKALIAKKQVELRYLRDDVAKLEERGLEMKAQLQFQATALNQNQSHYTYGQKRVSRTELATDAQRRLERARANERVLTSKRAQTSALESSLGAVQQKLEQMITHRELAQNKCAEIEAKLREVEARKAMTLNPELDSSSLAEASGILRELQKRIDVDHQMLENERPLLDEMPLDDVSAATTAEQIAAFIDPASVQREIMALTSGTSEGRAPTAER